MKVLKPGFFLLFLLGLLFLPACSDPNARRVLFVGNSYTQNNNLPKVVAQMAKAGGHSIFTDRFTQGGWRLSDHAAAADLLSEIESGQWQTVVLQEQSVLPSTNQRDGEMYPAARALHQQIATAGGQTVFFITWGRQNGTAVQQVGFNNFGDMQTQLLVGYRKIANELGAPMAPVGIAWSQAMQANPDLPLWDTDGSHPSKHGTYLAAAVFYAVLFNERPEAVDYDGGLPPEDARLLRRIAGETVLSDTARWNLPLESE